MPFRSKAQLRAAFGGRIPGFTRAKAEQWARETPSIADLPEYVQRNGASCSDAYIDNVDGAGATPNNGNVDYLGLRVRMSPSVFHALSPPLARSMARSADSLVEHMQNGGKIASPMLDVRIPDNWEDSDFHIYEPALVVGHEGRNRMYALSELCGPDEMVEVHIFPRGLRARHLKPAWIKALRQGMVGQHIIGRAGKLVLGPLFTSKLDLAPNPARASRNRYDYRTVQHEYEDFDGSRATEERSEGYWTTIPPHLTEGHKDLPEVLRALGVAELARKREPVTFLGRGNFGETYKIDLPTGPIVVKLPAAENIHGQPWKPEDHVRNFMHEAGVANELRELGVSIVPEVVYVETADGLPALIREYGEPVERLTNREYEQVERELTRVESIGWRVEDQIDLYRRPDGSFFVADVGIWHPMAIRPKSEEQEPYNPRDTSVSSLLSSLAQRMMGVDIETLPMLLWHAHFIRKMLDAERTGERGSAEFYLRMNLDRIIIESITARESLGLSVPSELKDAVAEAFRRYPQLAEELAQKRSRPRKLSKNRRRTSRKR
jgi:hypothetical protein